MAEDWIHGYVRDVAWALHARDEGSMSRRRITVQHDASDLANPPIVYAVNI